MFAAQRAAGAIVRRDVREEISSRFPIQPAIDDDHGDLLAPGVLDRSHERCPVKRRQDDPRHAFVHELLDDGDLLGAVTLFHRSLPHDVHAKLFSRRTRAGFDGFPEDVRRALGDHAETDLVLGETTCDTGNHERHEQRSAYGALHERTMLLSIGDHERDGVRIPATPGTAGPTSGMRRPARRRR